MSLILGTSCLLSTGAKNAAEVRFTKRELKLTGLFLLFNVFLVFLLHVQTIFGLDIVYSQPATTNSSLTPKLSF